MKYHGKYVNSCGIRLILTTTDIAKMLGTNANNLRQKIYAGRLDISGRSNSESFNKIMLAYLRKHPEILLEMLKDEILQQSITKHHEKKIV